MAPPQIRPAQAACAISITGNSGPVTNSAAINCIIIDNASVGGNVTNAAGGKISNVTATGIQIVSSTITGAVINNGSITTPDSTGIGIYANTAIQGGLSNSGAIIAKDSGIDVANNITFGGGISNSGTISSSNGSGIQLYKISTFSGGIANSGAILAKNSGINIDQVLTYTGGIQNSGTISSSNEVGIDLFLSSFSGGISNGGLIAANASAINIDGLANFSGGIANSGTISSINDIGIDITATTFAGGINNAGVIAAKGIAINIDNVANFSGGITNSGTISSSSDIGIDIETLTFSGGINNGGRIAAQASAIDIENVSNFSGGITNSGTISAVMNPAIDINHVSNFSGGIANTGTIQGPTGIEIGFISTFSGSITNAGTISAGRFGIFNNGVTVLGGISNTGTIIGHDAGIDENAGAPAVSIFDSGTITGETGTAISMSFSSPGNTLTLGPGYQINGKVLGTGSDIFQLGGMGSGAFDLSTLGMLGSTRQYQGFATFNVVSGTWTVSNTFGLSQAWNVNGGTLAGTGTLNSVNVNNGGTLEPGTIGTPGTIMTINGNLAFQSGAVYLVNIGPNSASRANVSGAVTLNGAVQVNLAPGSYNNKIVYDILDPSSITGKFNGVTVANDPGLTGNLSYSATDVLLTLQANLGGGTNLNQNQQSVASAVNAYFNNGGNLPAGFLPAFGLNGPSLGNALTQLDGENATGAEHAAFSLMNEFLGLMLDPFVYGRDGGNISNPGALGFAPDRKASLPPDIALAYADALKAPSPTFAQRWTVWGAGFGGSNQSNGDPAVGSNTVTARTYGYAAGMDYHYSPDTVLGFALAGGGTNWSLAQSLGTGRSDAMQAGIYGVTHAGPAYIAAAFAFANNWFSTNRTALAGDQLAASFQGQSYGARLEGGYRFALPNAHGLAGVTPYAAVQAQDFHTPSYSETDLTGGGFGLTYNAMTGTDTRSEVGSRFDGMTALGAMPLWLRAKLAWAHDWVSNQVLNASFESLPGAGFTVMGAPIPHDSALASAGAQLWFTPNWSFIAKFDGEFAASAQTYAGSGTLRYSW